MLKAKKQHASSCTKPLPHPGKCIWLRSAPGFTQRQSQGLSAGTGQEQAACTWVQDDELACILTTLPSSPQNHNSTQAMLPLQLSPLTVPPEAVETRSFTQLSLARSCCTKQPLRCNRIKKLAGQSPQKMKPKSHAYVKELWIMNTEAPAGIETKAKANEKKYPKPTYSLHASSPKSDTQKLLEHVSKISKG